MAQSIDTLKREAEAALVTGNLVRAQHIYQEILGAEPFSFVGLSGLLNVARMAGQLDEVARDLLVGALDLAAGGRREDAAQYLEPIVHLAQTVPAHELEPIIMLLVAGSISFANAEQFLEVELCCQPLFARGDHLPTETLVTALTEIESALISADALEIRVKVLRELRKFRPSDVQIFFQFVNALHNRCWQLTTSDPEKAILLAEEAYALHRNSDDILHQLVILRSRHGPPERLQVLLDDMIARFDRRAPAASQPKGLRELQGDHMTADDIADALLSDGAVLIRNMVTSEQQNYLLAEMDNMPWKQDEQAMNRALRPVILEGMAKIFGRHPIGLTQASGIRTARIDDDQTYLFYHQDLVPLYTMGINLWAALDPIDGTRPGLEVVVRRQHKAFPVSSGNVRNSTDYEISPSLVRSSFESSDFVCPKMAIGDGMMFLFSTVHSSHVAPGMTEPRRNMEFRFI